MVAISGYASDLYRERLKGWRLETRAVVTRGGSMAMECLWMNCPAPTRLHDVSFRGDNFRQREKYRRQLRRWVRRFSGMDDVQRQAIRQALEEAERSASPERASSAGGSFLNTKGTKGAKK